MMNKQFWKTFFNDTYYLRFQVMFGMVIWVILMLISPTWILFPIGYILATPFSYYFIIYKPKQKQS